MKLRSPELMHLIRNLPDAPLTDVVRAAAIAVEGARATLADIYAALDAQMAKLDIEVLDASLKPLIRELVKRANELEVHPLPAAGNA